MEPIINIGGFQAKQIQNSATVLVGKSFAQHRNVSKENESVILIGDVLANQPIRSMERTDTDLVDSSSHGKEI